MKKGLRQRGRDYRKAVQYLQERRADLMKKGLRRVRDRVLKAPELIKNEEPT